MRARSPSPAGSAPAGPDHLRVADRWDATVGLCRRHGIVVVPREVEAEVVRRAWDKVHAENITRDAIRAGMGATAAYAKYGVL